MRSEQQYLDEYAKSHQNPVNQVVHLICVPAIFLATFALLWFVPVGRWLPGVPAELSPYLNAATLGLPLVLGFYGWLSLRALLVGARWLAGSFAVILAGLVAGAPVLMTAAVIWLVAWAAQFWGHRVEGAKPSFADDLLFLLVGPLFVQQKLNRLMAGGRLQAH